MVYTNFVNILGGEHTQYKENINLLGTSMEVGLKVNTGKLIQCS